MDCLELACIARQRESIDTLVFDHEKRKVVIAVIGLRHDAAANLIDELGDQRVFHDLTTAANVAHNHAANLGLFGVVQDGVGRATHVRQLDVIRTGAADEDQRCEQ
jgi:hypothetical protein